MKKIVALFLALMMVLPMAAMAEAVPSTGWSSSHSPA